MKLASIRDLKVNKDDRGYLFEAVREDWGIDLKQVYIIEDPAPNTIRALHKHEKLIDYFCIVKGSAKFVFAKDDEAESVVLSEKCPQMITVPAGVYHGWKSLEPNTILVSVASELYNYENPDEERIPWDSFGEKVWEQVKK